jgi:hypothetical protein
MNKNPLVLSVVREKFGVSRFDAFREIPASVLESSFFSITRTADELSIICPVKNIPPDAVSELNWRCLKVHGPLDFGTTGIISSLTGVLSVGKISVLTISTYDTDYILLRESELDRAVDLLIKKGHQIHRDE